jgi:hypothetical protein
MEGIELDDDEKKIFNQLHDNNFERTYVEGVQTSKIEELQRK